MMLVSCEVVARLIPRVRVRALTTNVRNVLGRGGGGDMICETYVEDYVWKGYSYIQQIVFMLSWLGSG